MNHRIIAVAAGMALTLGLAAESRAQDAVINVVAVSVESGQLDDYVGRVKSLQGVMSRLEAAGTVQAWQSTLAGEGSGTVFVVIEYPSLAAYAESSTKVAADAEWQKLVGGLDAIRTIRSNSLYRQVGGGAAGDITADSVLQTVGVSVNPGKLDDYVARVDALQAVQTRVGSSGKMRVWQATLAGENSGNVVVGLVHPNLAAYAENTAKLEADAEWQKTIAGLDEIRSLTGASLSRNLGL